MDRRHLIAGGAGLLLAGLFAGSASARITAQGPVADEAGPQVEDVKRGGRGRHRRPAAQAARAG
ncbi:MAG TPA: hypothetical protein PLQ11_11880, partial [Beijerinckiaceae bacterium]|nr:hypothetical protein [Beijerinckiaceae bacterium]